jgi:hypothetical protein
MFTGARRLAWVVVMGGMTLVLAGGVFLWMSAQPSASRGSDDKEKWDEFAEAGVARYAELVNQGDLVAAEQHFERVDTALWAFGGPLDLEANPEEYESHLRRLIDFRERTVGEGTHLALALDDLIEFRHGVHDYAGAVEECDRSLPRIEAGFGSTSPNLAKTLLSCGYALKKIGNDVSGDALLARAKGIRAHWHP